MQLNTVAPHKAGADRDSVSIHCIPHHYDHLIYRLVEVEKLVSWRRFLDMITDAVYDSLAAVGIPDNGTERLPDFGHIWGTHVQKAHGCTSVVAHGGDRMKNFVSQGGGQLSHYA